MDPDVLGQLVSYPERCPPIFGEGDTAPCQILFLGQPGAGVYFNQPDLLGTPCCLVVQNIGPTPRNFTRGFNWNGTGTSFMWDGTEVDSDYYLSTTGFKYWTALGTHHDVMFKDAAGAFWAWDHLNVTKIDPSIFDLWGDEQTCNTPCPGIVLPMPPHDSKEEKAKLTRAERKSMEILARAEQVGPIGLAMHHHKLKLEEEKLKLEEEAFESELEQKIEEIINMEKTHNKKKKHE